MNKIVLIFAPVLAAGILFGFSGAGFMKSGIPETLPEHIEYATLSEKGKKLIMEQIIDPLQSKKKQAKAEMYSRCPSGIKHYVAEEPTQENPYFTGTVVDRSGCSSTTICYFRMDKKEEVLEAKSTEEDDYLPVAEWKKSMRGNWVF